MAVLPEVVGVVLPLLDLAEDTSDTKALVSEQLADQCLASVRTLTTNNEKGYCFSN